MAFFYKVLLIFTELLILRPYYSTNNYKIKQNVIYLANHLLNKLLLFIFLKLTFIKEKKYANK